MRSALKPTLVLMCGRGVALAVTFMIPVILVRTFDQEGFGTYKQVFLIYSTLFAIGQFGMAESLYYFLPKNPKSGGSLTLNAVVILAVMGIAGAAVLAAGASSISQALGNPKLIPFLPWLGAYLGLTLVGATLEIAMVARKCFVLAAITIAASEIFRALMFVIPAFISGQLKWLLAGGCAFALLRLAATGVFVIREFGGRLAPSRDLLWTQLAYTLPFQLAVLVETLQINFHQYAVSYYFDAATFAIYAVGCLQIPASELLAAPAANVMMVRMGEELREGRPQHARSIWDNTTCKLLLLMVPLTGLLVVTARDLMLLLFTKAYVASVSIFGLWALGTALQALPTDAVLRVFADTRTILRLNLVRLAFVALLIGFAISRLGLIGPVLVTLGAAVLAKALALIRLSQLMSTGWRHIVDWKTAGSSVRAAIVASIAAAGIRSRFDVTPIAGLLLSACVYIPCCLVMLPKWWLLKMRVIKRCAELPESSA